MKEGHCYTVEDRYLSLLGQLEYEYSSSNPMLQDIKQAEYNLEDWYTRFGHLLPNNMTAGFERSLKQPSQRRKTIIEIAAREQKAIQPINDKNTANSILERIREKNQFMQFVNKLAKIA